MALCRRRRSTFLSDSVLYRKDRREPSKEYSEPHDLDARDAHFGQLGAAVDHRFQLFLLPELAQDQVAWRRPMVDRLPGSFGRRGGIFDDLDHLAQLAAAGGLHYGIIADQDVASSAGVEVVNLPDPLKTNTDNKWVPSAERC